MKISDIFSRQSVYNSERNSEAQRVAEKQVEQTQREKGKPGEDRVSISPLARQFKQISEIVADDEQTRQARVAELKGQIEGGLYNVSSTDLAKSIVSFAKDAEF